MSAEWKPTLLHLDHGSAAGAPQDAAALLTALVDGSVPVIVLRGLFDPPTVTANRESAESLFHTARTTRYANGSLTTVGPYLAKYLREPDVYFDEAERAQKLLADSGFDLTARTRAALRELLGLRGFEPAVQPDGRQYAEQNVRIYPVGHETPLHNDDMRRDAAGTGLVLADLACHLSCVVCIQECEEGGELEVYRRKWSADDQRFTTPGMLGYDPAVVAGVPVHRYKPHTGDVYLLNPTHYHAIGRVGGRDRVTMGFFFGFFDGARTDAVSWV